MVKVIYLKKGQRRPRNEKTVLIDCRPNRRQEAIEQSAAGVTMWIRTGDLEKTIAGLAQKGVKKIHVRSHGDA